MVTYRGIGRVEWTRRNSGFLLYICRKKEEFLMGLQIIFTCLGFSMSFGGKEILSHRCKLPVRTGFDHRCVYCMVPAMVVSCTCGCLRNVLGYIQCTAYILIILEESLGQKYIQMKITGVQTRSRVSSHLALKMDLGQAAFGPSLLPVLVLSSQEKLDRFLSSSMLFHHLVWMSWASWGTQEDIDLVWRGFLPQF